MNLDQYLLFSDQVEETARTYERLLDANRVADEEGLVVLATRTIDLVIHETVEEHPNEPPPVDHPIVSVDSLDAAVAELRDRGLELRYDITEYDWGRSAYVADPDGRLIELTERNE